MVTVNVKQEEEGMCTSNLFSEDGMIGLLEQAAMLIEEVHIYISIILLGF